MINDTSYYANNMYKIKEIDIYNACLTLQYRLLQGLPHKLFFCVGYP